MILLHRSPIEVIQTGYIGYGWKHVNFSEYQNVNELLVVFKEKYPKANRHHNMIRRFFNLKAGDIVIVPIHRAIVIGKVIGNKRYIDGINNAQNQIKVDYLKYENGEIIKIPNNNLIAFLQTKLRTRRTNNLLRGIHANEILKIINQVENYGYYDRKIIYQQQIENNIYNFKDNLLKHIQQQKIWSKAGGRGLEELIKELFEIKGYNAKICAKNQSKGIDDIDVIAKNCDEEIVIQIKHHRGISGRKGIIQLREYSIKNNLRLKKIFITTANDIDNNTRNIANEHNIEVILGKELVDWIYESLPKLSQSTKEKLGIFESYQLVDF